ncbi:NADH-quinone oxidoreductase subunit NuoN [Nocardia sp. NPDC050175]|uniref:NADH-quinone oxidoreductase subunit NuoN n=1 Tax=Nocardia sp. NPDC050175 TaxID=3364317 RepID=UPI00378D8B13
MSSTIPAPTFEYAQLSPMLIVFGVAILGVLVETFLPRGSRYVSQVVLGLSGLVAAFVAVVVLAGQSDSPHGAVVMGSVMVDGPTLFLQGTILVLSIPAVMLMAERRVDPGGVAFTPQASAIPGSVAELEATKAGMVTTEVFPLAMFAIGGMLLFPSSNDLLTMFVALEVLSLPLYVLCGLARHRRLLSQEAALKYFLLGAFSSAFFLFGVALLYGYAGTVELAGIANAIATHPDDRGLAVIGAGMLSIGLLFKVGAVPFHSWIPDVYQGAPTAITAFMAAATKVAAFGALLRVFTVGLPGLQTDWRPLLWAIAILTMLVGALTAVTQTDIKRMLAYSSIAHVGFILIGVIVATPTGSSATLFYLLTYGLSTIGTFAIVTLVRDPTGEVTEITRWAGLGKRSPLLATTFALFLLALAGIPLTSGFIGKFAIFLAAIQTGATPLALVGILSSAIAAYIYIRIIMIMFFADPPPTAPEVTIAPSSALTTAAITFGAITTVVLGIIPQPVLNLTTEAATFLR